MRDYASQFKTLLGRLDSYDEGHMLNLFIWGLQPDLARSVSLHYPQSIAKAVSLAETTELAIKASRRPGWKSSTAGNPTKGQNQQNRGQGQWRGRGWGRGGNRGEGRSSVGSARGSTRGRGGAGRGQSYSVNYDPLACYRCGVRGDLARDCPQKLVQSQGSGNAGPSQKSFSGSRRGGPRNHGRGRQVQFGASTSCTMRTGRLIPWMMQVNCMSPSILNMLLVEEIDLRRKKENRQKAKKNRPESGL